jgi:hypothetical protein
VTGLSNQFLGIVRQGASCWISRGGLGEGCYRGPVQAARFLGIRDSRRRTLMTALIVALALHLPFTPLPMIIRWLSAYLHHGDTSWDFQDDTVVIPIALLEDTPPPEPKPPAAESEPQASTPQPAAPERPAPRVHDAGASDDARLSLDGARGSTSDDGGSEADAASDAALASDGAKRPGPASSSRGVKDAGHERDLVSRVAADASAGDAGGGGEGAAVKDTLSLVGSARSVVSGKANVSLAFWFSTMREHSLGRQVGGLLACNPQWRDFLGNEVDPLDDLDAVLLVGPQMRDTSKLTVLAQSRMEDAKIAKIMSRLAQKSGGNVMEGPGGTRAVRFRADRADRVALTHPHKMIIVTPPEGYEQIRNRTDAISLPPGRGQALSLTLVTPWRPLRNLGLHFPESLSEMRVNVFAAQDGGVDLQIEFDDVDAASAEAHASLMTDEARNNNMFVRDLEFVAQGNHLSGHLHLGGLISRLALTWVGAQICPDRDGG